MSEDRREVMVYTAGLLLWGALRDHLRAYAFDGEQVEWIESRGWISREFRVRAPRSVHQRLHALIDEMNKQPAT